MADPENEERVRPDRPQQSAEEGGEQRPPARGGRPGGGRGRFGGGRFGGGRRKEPIFADNDPIDYKDIARLRRCLDERGKILPRRRLNHSAHVQRQVTVAIKRARHMALLPYVSDSAGRPPR
jgi:small subunit ribosomal protein S18